MREKDYTRMPNEVQVITEDKQDRICIGAGTNLNAQCNVRDIELNFSLVNGELLVQVSSQMTLLREIVLTWKDEMKSAGKILADSWERSYGDLFWKNAEILKQEHISEVLPWYFLDDREQECNGYGVKVRPAAMCWWEIVQNDLRLHLDVRCGGQGVCLKGRQLKVATIIMKSYQKTERSVFEVTQNFCKIMCNDCIYDGEPIYGSNNWYYAYGKSSRKEIILDAKYLEQMTEGILNRPFMVIDDGWQVAHSDTYNGGPWDSGNQDYGDMKQLAADIKRCNVHPGIWFRPLLDVFDRLPQEWRCQRDREILDVSRQEVLEYVSNDLQRIADWGFELVKHDFSTKDIFGRWGFEMGSDLTDNGWHFHDTSRTTAEIIVAFYEAIYKAAGDMIILGCNCIGHLGAGLMHVNRIGDDTSGVEWERTRKMGVNTLAFRLPQHEAFFAVDADCVGITESIHWDKNRQWMNLLAGSGTPFFVSVRPGTLTPEQEEELKKAYRKASVKQPVAVPLDWKESKTPCKWEMGAKDKICRYEW